MPNCSEAGPQESEERFAGFFLLAMRICCDTQFCLFMRREDSIAMGKKSRWRVGGPRSLRMRIALESGDLVEVALEMPMLEQHTAMPTVNGLFLNPRFAYGFSVIGIVHRLFRRGNLVVDGISRCFEIFSDGFFGGEPGVIGTNGDARLGRGFAHKHQHAGFYRRQMRIAICRSGEEPRRRFYENSVKFTRMVATNGILAANPSPFECNAIATQSRSPFQGA
jgi:hypothetical protein